MQKRLKSARGSQSGNFSERTTQTCVLNPSFVNVTDAAGYKVCMKICQVLYARNIGWTKHWRSVLKKLLWGWHVGICCQKEAPYKEVTWLNLPLASPFTIEFHSSGSLLMLGYCKVFPPVLSFLSPQVTRYTGKDISCLRITLMHTKINS